MTDPVEFLEKVLADPETKATIQALHDKAEGYGEDKDLYLNYVLGHITSWYTSKELMLVNMEGIKLMVLLQSFGAGLAEVQGILRRTTPSETARPV